MSDETQAQKPGPEVLAEAVAAFERQFKAVDDNYMHGAAVSRTRRGAKFVRVLGGTEDVTRPIAYDNHKECASDWFVAAAAKLAEGKGAVLVWRVQPHFITHPVRGFYIDSVFTVEEDVDPDYTDDQKKLVRVTASAGEEPAKPGA